MPRPSRARLTSSSTNTPRIFEPMARYYPHLFNRLKSFVHDNHFDIASLSILNEVDGGFYDTIQNGYTYSFTIKVKYDPPIHYRKCINYEEDVWREDIFRHREVYITIECKHDTLRGSEVFGVTVMETRPSRVVLCNSTIFNDNLVRKQIEHSLDMCLLPF